MKITCGSSFASLWLALNRFQINWLLLGSILKKDFCNELYKNPKNGRVSDIGETNGQTDGRTWFKYKTSFFYEVKTRHRACIETKVTSWPPPFEIRLTEFDNVCQLYGLNF